MPDTRDDGGPTSEKTLLDEFAGQAMKSLLRDTDRSWTEVHKVAYQVAENMIAEKRRREKQEDDDAK